MNQLPLWAQWIQFGATISIAAFAGLIVAVQSRTARAKLALDLFEKRFAIFMDVRRITSEATQLGRLTDRGLPFEVLARGRFLFGPAIQGDLDELGRLTICQETGDMNAVAKIDAHFRQMIPKFEQYLRMQQKVPFSSVRVTHGTSASRFLWIRLTWRLPAGSYNGSLHQIAE
jgi:hypothetical protein